MNVPATMQALLLRRLGYVESVEMPVPRPGPGEVLVQTAATTICTSDLIDVAENPFGGPLPRVLGHEAAGMVAAAGEGVDDFRPGQPVAAHPVIPCRQCTNCRRGLGHLCLDMGHLGLNRDGTFAEFFRIRADRLLPVPQGMGATVAALLEPVAVCLEAVRRARIAAGDCVLVLGDGPFGVITARLATRIGAKVLILGHHEFRMRHATGAVAIDERRESDVLQVIRNHAGAEGVDEAILCAGSPEAVGLGLAALRARGRLVVFSGISRPVPLDLFRVHVGELEILGACNDEGFREEALVLLADEQLALRDLITHRLPLSRWQDALHLAGQGKDEALKVAFVLGED